VRLADTADHVEVPAYIRPGYVKLVRQGTKFWRTGGARVKAGLFSGVSLDVESMHSLLMGGVSMAVPPDAGEIAQSGQSYDLHEKAEEEWLEWAPRLAGEKVVRPAKKEREKVEPAKDDDDGVLY
jgi:paraquat-inducible protein B